MTNAEFRELCRETCLLLRIEDVSSLADEGQIMVDEVTIGAFHDDASDTGIHCYVDLGAVHEASRPEEFQQILALNLELGRMHGETLGYDRESERFVLRSEVKDLAHISAKQMSELFIAYVGFAKMFSTQWQRDAALPMDCAGSSILQDSLV